MSAPAQRATDRRLGATDPCLRATDRDPGATYPRLRATDPRRGAAPSNTAGALLLAALCLVGLAATWVVAALVPITHAKDAAALYDFTRLGRPRVDLLANHILHLLEPGLYTVWAIALVALALLRRRPRLALAVAVVLPLAPLSAELLKPLLAHPHAYSGLKDITAASWPSGHATAAMTLALCAMLVFPYALRPLVAALGMAFVAGVGISLLILAWHMPSDVFGGYLLAGLWVSLALALLRATAAPYQPPRQTTARYQPPRQEAFPTRAF